MTGAHEFRVGIAGSGFIARHVTYAIDRDPQFQVSRVLTRSDVTTRTDYPHPELLTNSLHDLIEASDVILECTGDPIRATDIVDAALRAGRPVVTMNSEFHVTAGSYFVGQGVLTEAEGDQPGCLASLREEAIAMGFRPLVYGNMKGFLNHTPTLQEMEYWGAKQGISLPMVTAFTDGTKLQFEQALVANAFGATVAVSGMLGPQEDDLRAAGTMLGERAIEVGRPIADYVLSGALPHGVFIVAEHQQEHRDALAYYKMGPGPHYTLVRNNIFVHLEILKTLRRVVSGQRSFLDNSSRPRVSVAAIAKRAIRAGTRIEQPIGSFDLRGETVRIADHAGHLPIGLLAGGVIERDLEPGEPIQLADVTLPESLALRAWLEVERRVLESPDLEAEDPVLAPEVTAPPPPAGEAPPSAPNAPEPSAASGSR